MASLKEEYKTVEFKITALKHASHVAAQPELGKILRKKIGLEKDIREIALAMYRKREL